MREKIETILNYAIRAPSTHNSQPWLFKIEGDICKIYIDEKLKLPKADPESRGVFISMGCMIENLRIASEYFGVFEKINYGPFNEKNLVAIVSFKAVSIKPRTDYRYLLEMIPRRINARGIFHSEAPSVDLVQEVTESIKDPFYPSEVSIHILKDVGQKQKIAQYTAEGIKLAYRGKDFRREMSQWMHTDFSRKKDGLMGYALKMPFILSLIIPNIIRFVDIGWLLARLNIKSITSAPLIMILTSSKNDEKTWLSVGRIGERLMLEWQVRGWQTSIFTASIEMGDLFKKVQKILSTNERPHFIFIVGKIDSLHKLTPRHDVKEKLI